LISTKNLALLATTFSEYHSTLDLIRRDIGRVGVLWQG